MAYTSEYMHPSALIIVIVHTSQWTLKTRVSSSGLIISVFPTDSILRRQIFAAAVAGRCVQVYW